MLEKPRRFYDGFRVYLSDPFDDLLICRLSEGRKAVEPCVIIIFGASGDLTARKLVPALYHLFKEKQMPPAFSVVGVARREKTDASWRTELRSALDRFSRTQPVDEAVWQDFAQHLQYCQGDLTAAATYEALRKRLAAAENELLRRNLLLYLATSPSQFGEVVEQVYRAGLLHKEGGAGWQRVVVEKPFGHDLASARQLNQELTRFAGEHQIFRIDHYLGKETVQNIMMFRFSNAVFERLWNRESIDHFQITVSEKLGVGQRGGYYEEAGALRDMVQNHLLQVLSLVAMEPPVSLAAEAIRDEKVKLLKSIRPLSEGDMARQVVRGQYSAGIVAGEQRLGYRQEAKVNPSSNVETYVALKLFIDNWRWSGVPFYLRTGKNLPLSTSEVRVQFRRTPHVLFAAQCGQKLDPNALTLHLQPHEGISLRFNGKVPGTSVAVRPVRMHFSYDAEFGAYTPEAYERLLLEAMAGDATLFIRRDEVEAAWQFVDDIRRAWEHKPLTDREFYAAGTWGPVAAEDLLAQNGHAWREPLVVRV
ncbi:MAG TPA: glucose-6-phosphate dehydrogenase [Verrucomicrobiota bacterium]|nr:glucose-6-phosphate dehydrogenase [Verrucomicrobiota bacterium]HNZ75437.1 glucose-6-phosphate dehydrogenase [Verrucomicrobiota bacterium]HOH39996.1 glucose-6-phosphate dehydrogenase [Verrucomicrobiota bacterium]HOX61588.1 glucose-6-phosphate dehydrogenase [Verrucomicrobiota bacterium]HPI64013.1 glucose-6-phosphate dehydrogenase [Verrucomicrobiota bacterium]